MIMNEFTSIDDILDFAIGEEQAAVDFYLMLASQAKSGHAKQAFIDFAKEEMVHKARLMQVREKGLQVLGSSNVSDLKLADYLVDVEPSPDMSYQEALILAMKKEKAAFRLYTCLATRMEDPAMRQTFELLALEESKHKLSFELEYDEQVLREN